MQGDNSDQEPLPPGGGSSDWKADFDVFLSHNSKDKPVVRELAEALHARGLRVWLDEWELVPGRPWQEALEEIIETTRASIVLVGKDGLGPWQDREMRSCLSEFVDRKLPVIPVLLPDAPERPTLPIFLKGFTWVDLRGGFTEEGLDRLLWGVTDRRPDRRPDRPSLPIPNVIGWLHRKAGPRVAVNASRRVRAQSRLGRWAVAFSVGFSVSWLLFFLPFLDPLTYLIPLSLKPGLGTATALLFGLLTLVFREREHLGPGSLKVLRGWALLGIVALALLLVFQNRFIVRFNHANSSGRASEIIAPPRLFKNCPGCEAKAMSDEACIEEKNLDSVVLARCWDSSRRTQNQTAWTLAYLMTISGAASFVGLLWLRLGKARPPEAP